jgi:Ca-activated chloride channel family protein
MDLAAIDFATPGLLWLALAAPAAALVAALLWRRRLAADAAWAARGLWDRLLATYSRHRLALSVVLLAVAVAGTALALARPRWGGVEKQVERRGVDVVFVLDSSLSMSARDVVPSRLGVAESVIRTLVRQMPGNRVALVQAEGSGVVLTPLTLVGGVIDLLLDAVEPGSLPKPGTELAPALDSALELYAETGPEHRVLVLISDGEDHGGRLDAGIDRLRREGVVVIAVGVGTLPGAPIPLPRVAGRRDDYKRDDAGDVVISRLEEARLEEIAYETGGVYVRATSAAADLSPVVDRIGEMATRRLETDVVDTREERFQWPLAAAALALVAHLALGPFRRRERSPA